MRDFTLHQYSRLLDTVSGLGLPVYGVLEWVLGSPDCGVLIRHDVDRKPGNALAMARLESKMSIRSTYYFRIVGSAYDVETIKAVADLGHEVGYHYEDLSLAGGDTTKAHAFFAAHLDQLRKICNVRTIAMHGSPLSRFSNLDMWETGTLGQYGLTADAFFSVDYAGVPYFTDTGRSWAASAANLRDRPKSAGPPPVATRTTNDLVAFIVAARIRRFALSAHPERWAGSMSDWCLQLALDTAVNGVKRILRAAR